MRKVAANRPAAPVEGRTWREMGNCLCARPARTSGPTEQVAGTSLSSTPQIRVQPRSHPAVPAVRMSSKESDSRMSVEQQIAQLIATEIAAKATQVVAAIGLLDEGATVQIGRAHV